MNGKGSMTNDLEYSGDATSMGIDAGDQLIDSVKAAMILSISNKEATSVNKIHAILQQFDAASVRKAIITVVGLKKQFDAHEVCKIITAISRLKRDGKKVTAALVSRLSGVSSTRKIYKVFHHLNVDKMPEHFVQTFQTVLTIARERSICLTMRNVNRLLREIDSSSNYHYWDIRTMLKRLGSDVPPIKRINCNELAEEISQIIGNRKEISLPEFRELAIRRSKNHLLSLQRYNLDKILGMLCVKLRRIYPSKRSYNTDYRQRRIAMANMTSNGYTLEMIAKIYNITKQAVSEQLKVARSEGCVVTKISKKKAKLCKVCGTTYNNDRKYCSDECMNGSRVAKIKQRGAKWSKHCILDLKCHVCGKDFKRSNYLQSLSTVQIRDPNAKKDYCSRECYFARSINR